MHNMIQQNEQRPETPQISEEELAMLQKLDPIKVLWLVLNTVSETGSISVSQAHIEGLPDPPPLEIRFDGSMWRFKIPGKKPKKRKRGIIKPRKKIIVPGKESRS